MNISERHATSMIWLTRFLVRSLERAGVGLRLRRPQHLLLGKRGEVEAYLHLRALGYTVVAANFRAPYNRAEIDLIGWDEGVLCFIEVKTRTSADFAPPSTAVDSEKRRHIRSVARQYLRRLPVEHPPQCRFDIVSVVLGADGNKPEIRLQKGAFSWDAGSRRKSGARDFRDRYSWRKR